MRTYAARFLAAAALGTGLAAIGAAPAWADTGVTVTPSTDLTDGQVVAVAGAGFTPGETAHLVQCTATFNACDVANRQLIPVAADGSVAASYTVNSKFEGLDVEGNPVGQIDCTAVECAIGLGESPTVRADAKISFE
jgi:hypothetical protein